MITALWVIGMVAVIYVTAAVIYWVYLGVKTTTSCNSNAAGIWHRYNDQCQPPIGASVITYVEHNDGSKYYSLGNPDPDEKILWWAYIFYPPRIKENKDEPSPQR